MHHIFFPPRLELVVRQGHSYGLPSDLPHDPSFHHLGGDQADGPPRVAVRWRATDQRHNRGLLDAVQLARAPRPVLVGERRLQAAGEVALANPRHLPVVPADRFRGGVHTQAAVQVLQRQDPPPHPRAELAGRLDAAQFREVAGLQLEPREALRVLHPNA